MKESGKIDKYQDLARELKKLWNMKVMIIPIAIGALGTVTKRWVQGLEDLEIREQVETIQNTALLRLATILTSVLEACCHSNFSEKSLANGGVKKSQKTEIIKFALYYLVLRLMN